ncbi:MAG: metal ABC transporter permease [Actinomycetota bacterium]
MTDWLFDPWRYAFFRHGLMAAIIAGSLCGGIGSFVILRRMSYIGHGLSHAIFGGAVVGYLIGGNFYLIGGAWGAVAALIIDLIGRTKKVGTDAAIGIVTTASFAIGVALISRGQHFTRNFEAALFGDILGVTKTDLAVLAGVSAAVGLAIFLFYKRLVFITFDPDVADTYGIDSTRVEIVFSLCLAATIVATMRILGVTLIAATIVTPAVVARLSTNSFAKMLLRSVLIGGLTGAIGMYASFYLNIASGATITLTATSLFILMVVKNRFSGPSRRGGLEPLAEIEV